VKVRPRQSIILDLTVDLLFHTVLLVALFFLFAGHNRPGGGFIGGLVAGGALVLRLLSGRTMPGLLAKADPLSMMGAGVALAAGTGIVALFAGGEFLESGSFTVHPPLLGTVKVFSVLAFDIGVFLVVIGMILAELAALGPDEDDDAHTEDVDPEWVDDEDEDDDAAALHDHHGAGHAHEEVHP
jgi:multisubunit Na+/H+ antiporter MnhB subunit